MAATRHGGRRSGGGRAPQTVPPTRRSIVAGWIADLAVLGVALAALVRLAGFAAHARFTSDECFHAWMSRWIAAHGTLPRQVDGLYSGFKYFYPPLLHLAGAAAIRLFGTGAFRFVNVACLGLLFALTWIVLARLHSRVAARIGLALLLAYPGLLLQGVRLYVEALSALLTVACVLALWALLERPATARALLCGACAGLAVLAKQSALILFPVFAALGALMVFRRDGPRGRALALAGAVALALAAPYWVRNAVLFGSPVYPVFGRDIDAGLAHLNRIGFTPGPRVFFAQVLRDAGPVVVAGVGLALGAAAVRRRGWEALLLGGAAVILLVSPAVPMLDSRHVIPLVALLVALSAPVLADTLAPTRLVSAAAQIALLLVAGSRVVALPDLRAPLDPGPRARVVFDAIRANVPATGSRILALETYDVFYYTGRATTWPIPWGQKDPPVDIFDEDDPARILSDLQRHGIDYLLLPSRWRGEEFNTANFPRRFILGMADLLREGRIEVVWRDEYQGLIHVVDGARAPSTNPPDSTARAPGV